MSLQLLPVEGVAVLGMPRGSTEATTITALLHLDVQEISVSRFACHQALHVNGNSSGPTVRSPDSLFVFQ